MNSIAAAYYDRRIPWFLRLLSCFDYEPRSWLFRWGEILWRWGIALEVAKSEDHWYLIVQPIFGKWFVKLPRWIPHTEPAEMMDAWGFAWSWGADGCADLFLNWGSRSKVLWMPWRWDHYRTEILLSDGTWRLRKSPMLGGEAYDSASAPLPDVHSEQHPYHYMLDNGETQHVTATLTVERSEHRIRCLRFLPWPRRLIRYIDVWFSDEVGERAGSWKGGCLGCGYTMNPGETPYETLRRMQRERRFR